MGIGKDNPLGSELIHVRCSSLRISLQHPIPVIEIIDRDKQNIGFSIPATRIVSHTVLSPKAKQYCEKSEYRRRFTDPHRYQISQSH